MSSMDTQLCELIQDATKIELGTASDTASGTTSGTTSGTASGTASGTISGTASDTSVRNNISKTTTFSAIIAKSAHANAVAFSIQSPNVQMCSHCYSTSFPMKDSADLLCVDDKACWLRLDSIYTNENCLYCGVAGKGKEKIKEVGLPNLRCKVLCINEATYNQYLEELWTNEKCWCCGVVGKAKILEDSHIVCKDTCICMNCTKNIVS